MAQTMQYHELVHRTSIIIEVFHEHVLLFQTVGYGEGFPRRPQLHAPQCTGKGPESLPIPRGYASRSPLQASQRTYITQLTK
jgi:hypothetical protein